MFKKGVEFPVLQMEDFLSGRVKTLGWQILHWCSEYLGHPDGKRRGQPFVFTKEQALFILRLYALRPDGTFWYADRAILERSKGWGKSPLLATLCCAELLGPVRFSHWDENGEPVGEPEASPLIQIAAISEVQADNTYSLVMEMLREGKAYDYYSLKGCIFNSKVEIPGVGVIQKVTASPRGREGQRVTFVVCDETHLWVPAEKGPELFEALERNAVKMDNRIVETTNAPVPGEGSVAEISYNAVVQVFTEAENWEDIDILLDTRQVIVDDIYDREVAYPALAYVYGDSAKENGGWMNLDRVWKKIVSPSTREHVARRFYFNQKVEGHSTWLHRKHIEDIIQEVSLHPDDKFALGFSGNIKNSAALVACRLEDNALFLLGLWERPDREDTPEDWEVPFVDVDTRIRKMLSSDRCWKLVCNPENWQEVAGRWAGDFEDKVESFWLTKNKSKAAKAVEQFETAVKAQRLSWIDPNLSRHVLNAHATELPNDGGVLIRQESPHSKRYITAAQAAVLALESAVLSISEGALQADEEYELYSF